jgi:hypothetical protein
MVRPCVAKLSKRAQARISSHHLWSPPGMEGMSNPVRGRITGSQGLNRSKRGSTADSGRCCADAWCLHVVRQISSPTSRSARRPKTSPGRSGRPNGIWTSPCTFSPLVGFRKGHRIGRGGEPKFPQPTLETADGSTTSPNQLVFPLVTSGKRLSG